MGLLKSAQKHESTVRRVVVTGSICAVISWPTTEPRVYEETLVNDVSIEEVREGSTDPVTIYCAAKTESEKSTYLQ